MNACCRWNDLSAKVRDYVNSRDWKKRKTSKAILQEIMLQFAYPRYGYKYYGGRIQILQEVGIQILQEVWKQILQTASIFYLLTFVYPNGELFLNGPSLRRYNEV